MQRLSGGTPSQTEPGLDALASSIANQLDRLTCRVAATGPIAVAVSGGSDSMAVLHLTHAWARARGRNIVALTVDHGLRAGSADEANRVAERCAHAGIEHHTLTWSPGRTGARLGGLQRKARMARHRLLGMAAREAGATGLVTGHTLNDQWETFLMRARQGSGWYGLGGMDPVSVSPAWPEGRGVFVLRPLLRVRRSTLRGWLAAQDMGWVEDPSNEDKAFERVRMRQLLATAPPSLLARVSRVQGPLEGLRQVERHAVAETLERSVRVFGTGQVSWRATDPACDERAARVLSLLIQVAAGSGTPPRGDAVRQCLSAIRSDPLGPGRTLGGARVAWEGPWVLIDRDPGLMAPPPGPDDPVWDSRFERTAGTVPTVPLNRDYRPQSVGQGERSPPDLGRWRALAAMRLQAMIASMKS